MREILFRGFHPCEDGEREVVIYGERIIGRWVYGYPLIDTAKCSLKEKIECQCEHDGTDAVMFVWEDALHKYEEYEVLSETIGEYIGVTDINGKKVFEGDIIETECFYIYGVSIFDYFGGHDFEVAGSIFWEEE